MMLLEKGTAMLSSVNLPLLSLRISLCTGLYPVFCTWM